MHSPKRKDKLKTNKRKKRKRKEQKLGILYKTGNFLQTQGTVDGRIFALKWAKLEISNYILSSPNSLDATWPKLMLMCYVM